MPPASRTLRRTALLALLVLVAGLAAWWFSRPRQPIPDGTRPLPALQRDGRFFTLEGRRIEIRGVNYLRHRNEDAARCPEIHFGADANCPYDQAAISADMAQLHSLGVNVVRIFLNYYAFGGARAADPNYSSKTALANLDQFIAAANRNGIYVLPVLLIKYPQDRFAPADYATALDLHVRPVVTHLAGRPGILAWDLFNEPDLGGPVDARCWDWDNADFALCAKLADQRLAFVKMLRTEVKRLDPQTLATVSLGFAKNYFRPEGSALRLADMVDFYSFHYYDDDPYDSGRYAQHWYYGQGFPEDLRRAIRELHDLGLEKPVLISEIGYPTGAGARRSLDQLPARLEASQRVAREEEAAGMLLWPFQEPSEQLLGTLFH